MCYYCPTQQHTIDNLLDHYFRNHANDKLKLRKRDLDSEDGTVKYIAVHFGINVKDFKDRIEKGQTYNINFETTTIQFKRKHSDKTIPDDQSSKRQLLDNTDNTENEKQETKFQADGKDIETFKSALEVLKTHGNSDNFMAVLTLLSNGTLHPSNIALHLLLDIGNLLSQASFTQVRYSKTTLDFWAIVHRLFKGKATRFFRGTIPALPNGEGN